MRFFADHDGRRASAVWSWRNSTMVVSLALISSLAMGIGAAGGLSVLDEPDFNREATPPLAEPKPPVLLPLEAEPPPSPNPAQRAEPAERRDIAPAGGETFETRQVEAEPVPESAQAPVETVTETGSGVWQQVEENVDKLPDLEWRLPSTQVYTWEKLDCPELEPEPDEPSQDDDHPSWDTEYTVPG